MKKQMTWKTKGMNRDLSVSAFNPEFAFENLNLRLSTKEGNTMMSWVNEKGTAELSLKIDIAPWIDDADWSEQTPKYTNAIDGIPVGTAVIEHKLVLFTHENSEARKHDHIYVLWKNSDSQVNADVAGKIIYNGNLGFDTESPIETLVSFESNSIQKVYWTDGENQPRVINIEASAEKLELWNSSTAAIDTFFDFVPTIQNSDDVVITNHPASGGTFAPGVIQYCFTYFNKHGQQSNIVYVSPIYYTSFVDRAGSGEDKVANTFDIEIKNPDESFDYIRLYSIQRTSIDAVPIVKVLEDLNMKNVETVEPEGGSSYDRLTYTDKGTTGYTIDPTELLFVGGREITVLTMTDKDNTLFMGNLTEKNISVEAIQDYFLEHPINNLGYKQYYVDGEVEYNKGVKDLQLNHATGTYTYTPELDKSQEQITTFKGGETYRFGFQLQKKTGEWTEPIFLKDVKNELYPDTNVYDDNIHLTYAEANIPLASLGESAGNFQRIRPIVVFPSIGDRSVICQGVLNPTVFNVEDRKDKMPFAQASWFFRPYIADGVDDAHTESSDGAAVPFTHYDSLVSQASIIAQGYTPADYAVKRIEIQGSQNSYPNPYYNTSSGGSNTQFFIDQSIVTLNSPDIEFDTEVQSIGWDKCNLRIIGAIPITSEVSGHDIVTSTVKWPVGQNTPSPTFVYGRGELQKNVLYNNISVKAGRRLSSEYLWNDSYILTLNGNYVANIPYDADYSGLQDFLVSPWNRNGSLNSDPRGDTATSKLETKKFSNLLFSANTEYFVSHNIEADYSYQADAQIHLQENEQIYDLKLPKQLSTSSDIHYYPNIDKELYNRNGYIVIANPTPVIQIAKGYSTTPIYRTISMRYKSGSHVVLSLYNGTEGATSTPILPYGESDIGKYVEPNDAESNNHNTFWGDTVSFYQSGVDTTNLFQKWIEDDYDHQPHNFLWLGELYNDSTPTFGGNSKEAIRNNRWQVGGKAVNLPASDSNETEVTLQWTIGDTYYQRYDSLKTYAYSPEDTNQIVEILSFMCETRVNLDGRYDRNRGQSSNIDMYPGNFNLMNDVYSQKDNYFTYKKTDNEDTSADIKHPNYIAYSKKKESGADVDLYTNVTLGSVLEMDGDKGQVTSLRRLNDKIIAFQDRSVSQVLYNENVQISAADGVPIEIANSEKVQGKRYLSDTIGCSNKWSVVSTPMGIYFMDSADKSIYLFNDKFTNLSEMKGFDSWSKMNIPTGTIWNPVDFDSFVSYYDSINDDVLFINKDTCLAFSEKMGVFTSFYSYENAPYLCDLDGEGVWINKSRLSGNNYKLWRHQEGDYNKFFDKPEPFHTILVGNPEPQTDKIFTNLEFRACVEGEYTDTPTTPLLPFDSLETWDEYQHGIAKLETKFGHYAFKHHTQDTPATASLKRKFRIWRCDIPRDNYPFETYPVRETGESDAAYNARVAAYNLWLRGETDKGIYRYSRKAIDRMRNPWIYLKLMKEASNNQAKTEIHDMVMSYFT